jgi:hydroxypyruvate reductase
MRALTPIQFAGGALILLGIFVARPPERAGMSPVAQRRATLLRAFDAAVAAAHPRVCLRPHLPPPPSGGRLVVLAAGKAGASMAAVADAFYRESHGFAAEGLAVTRHGYAEPAGGIEVIEAGHPVPDQAGIAATVRSLAMAQAAGKGDLVLVLLSGGGSANWIAPAGDLTLTDKQGITRALLRSGATIGEINTVRKHLSRIKGGRLAQAASPARVLTLAISDVPHDDPPSSPPADGAGSFDARRRVGHRDAPRRRPAASARALLDDAAQRRRSPAILCSRGASSASSPVQPTPSRRRPRSWRRRATSPWCSAPISRAKPATSPWSMRARRSRSPATAGAPPSFPAASSPSPSRAEAAAGPNQEYALALAVALAGAPGIAALGADTDGTDGGAGSASDPAGAMVDETTLARAQSLGLDAGARLADNDSTAFFEPLGDLVATGPTRTNVNDCRIILIG